FLDLNRERTMEGLKAALARGRKGGRRKKLTDADLVAARAMLKDHTISVAEISRRMGVTRGTFYQYFPAARRQAGGA
ncbi:helix-turn-helix domain-containing protein, partial [Lichenihabitans sp. Uapishka_5]|uniref:helix-turn-helix domain-containing protein n=1 Tax=Lichenihabitans sp. Uapishka_5 TaxID=3037302 RepID=UPI0029E801BC